ncbi:hypothetical protein ABH922_003029 [Rhodococcus sp. 27YEA15]|uniref:hypothetical protein n=1 Tax=Rhodococcus sp. 27YEA15 TaxID=3156259 RepID=UPI003C7C3F42
MNVKPVLIRAWDSKRAPIGHSIAPFAGGFTLPDDHPLAQELLDFMNKHKSVVVTVLTTNEVEWHVKTVTHRALERAIDVECKPHSEHVRDCLVSDDWFGSHLPGGEPA